MLSLLFLAASVCSEKWIFIEKQSGKSPSFATDHVMIGSTSMYFVDAPTNAFFDKSFSDKYIIEKDTRITLNDYSFTKDHENTPWHLDRIVKRTLPLTNEFPHKTCLGSTNVNTYIIDTGIDTAHSQFQGRATWLANFADSIDTDCNSHGTHCAGLVGSLDYGVCKDARLYAIKVLDCKGSGMLSGVIKGIEYAFNHHQAQNKKELTHSVLSMSLGGGYSQAINRAVEAVLQNSEHLHFTVASGNEDSDACNTSPASAKGVFSVMASDMYDNRAYFSNYGKCADIYSPGVNIKSTIPGEQTAVYSGTSMATPILAGVLNHYIVMYPTMNYKQLKSKVLRDATKGVIKGRPKDALVYLPTVFF